ncbi:hypothetical protein [Stomatohabitans albus]|uniref:hypothetical protein n=1 Tax=Stomatohabitans albus TaxID=3110766 RepID=UPI00300D0A1B
MSEIRPGVQFVREFAPRKTSPAVDTRTTFMVGLTKAGVTDAQVLVRSFAEFQDAFQTGGQHSKVFETAVAAFFQFGNAPLWVAKVADAESNGKPNDAAWQAALDLFTVDLGPGQVLAPGQSDTKAHKRLAAHALATNRVALLDGAKDADPAALKQLATGLAVSPGSDRCALFGNWAVTPDGGDIPASVIAAIQTTKVDAISNIQPIEQQATPIAGITVKAWADKDKTAAYKDGANLVISRPGGVVLGGYRSVLADPGTYDFSATRLMMWLEAQIKTLSAQFIGSPITTDTVATFHGAVASLLSRVFSAGGLFGETAQEAYLVDTRSVNTPETAAKRELNARVSIRIAEHVELVKVHAVSVPVTETI